ncbi:MAG: hypothetical protein ACXAC5_00295 [Promethearchaeota archaeon]|jgi:hypothetical protein
MSDLITQSKPVFSSGTVFAQIASFNGTQVVDKVVLNLTTTNADLQTMVVGTNGNLLFQAANFRSGRKTWAFHPMIHWAPASSWDTSGTTIRNSGQIDAYTSSTDAGFNAPFIKYELFLDVPGTYDLWGRGYTSSEGAFWSWDGDVSDMRRIILGQPTGPPEWTKFGTVFSQAGGRHTFSIYLSDASTVILDQWYFTQDTDFDQSLSSQGLEFTPLTPLSKAPFNTVMRARSLNNGALDDLIDPVPGAQIVTAWSSSEDITASGKYNYLLQTSTDETSVTFEDGLSLEFWQIGGSSDHFAAWDFSFPTTSVGDAFKSTDFAENYTAI